MGAPSSTGTVKTLAGTGNMGFRDGSTTALLSKPKFNCPVSVCCSPDGLIYVSDWYNDCIRCVDRKTSTVRTLAGNRKQGHKDGVAEEAQFALPSGLVHHEGKLYVTDVGTNCVRCIDICTGECHCGMQ